MTSSIETQATNPWEEREDLGWVRAFGRTAWMVVRRPRRLYSCTRPELGLKEPLVFGVLAAALGFGVEAVVYTLVQLLFPELMPAELSGEAPIVVAGGKLAALPRWLLSALGCQAAFLLSPIVVALYTLLLLLWAGILHFGVVVLGGRRRSEAGFAGTMAVGGYAATTLLAQVVPFLGDIVFVLGTVALTAIGLQEIHGTTRGRSLLIAGLPILLPFAVAVAILVARLLGGESP